MTPSHRILKQKVDLDTGVVLSEVYWRSNLKHRDPAEGAADIRRDPKTGIATSEIYMVDGLFHRLDGPAIIKRDGATGIVTEEVHYEWHTEHRLDGPAVVRRDGKTGAVIYESYHEDGLRHRPTDEGPAVMQRDPMGNVSEEYWVANKRVAPPSAAERPDNDHSSRSPSPEPR